MRGVGLLHTVRAYVDALVHPSALADKLTAARHRAFIAPRLLGSFVALGCFPLYLALRGVPSTLEVAVFAWLVLPILISFYLSRSGNYEVAHLLSSVALTGLVVIVSLETGGMASFAAIWLILVPLEAALSASRRAVAVASTVALVGAVILLVGAPLGETPGLANPAQAVLAALGIVSAALYASGLAFGFQSLARTGFWLLQAEEERYRLLARNMTDVITRHKSNGLVVFASPAAESVFGVSPDALRGHGLFDRVHVADRPAYLKTLSDASRSHDVCTVEFRVRRENNAASSDRVTFVDVEMRCQRFDDGASERSPAQGDVVAVMRDVSARRQYEQALVEARAQAERANTAKSQFLATMSHELRTPLNVIIGFSDMLVNADSLNVTRERRDEYARMINDSGSHLLSVVNGILDMSKIENGEFDIRPEPFLLAPVVTNCCDLLSLKARDGEVALVADLPPDLPEIVADKRAVKQILLNLVSNAIKFSHRGGAVTVGAAVEGDMIALSIADEGIGISADDLPRLGKPFFQAKSSYDRTHDGAGLGLSIVRGLVDLHGGAFAVHSGLNRGTRVTVRLPLDCEGFKTKSGASPIPHARARAERDVRVRKSA